MDEILKQIKSLTEKKEKVIIAIDGRGGSGKSTFSKKLQNAIPNSELVVLDGYQKDSADLFCKENIDRNFEIQFENREFLIGEIKNLIVKSSSKVFILEGCFSFKNLIGISIDYKIWIETPKLECEKRLNQREKQERIEIPHSIIELSTKKYQEAEDRYIESFSPRINADVIF